MAYYKTNKYLFLIFALGAGYFVLNNIKNPFNSYSVDKTLRNSTESKLTLKERINKTALNLKLKKDISKQALILDQLQNPEINNSGMDVFEQEDSLDMGIRFSNHENIKSISKELAENSLENDLYVDPENHIRRQIAHQNFAEEYQKHKNESQKKLFIKQFVQSAYEQGYRVHFKKNMEVILEPLDPEQEEQEESEEIEPLKVIVD